MNGFGWNFYGFFLAAGAWLGSYFLWAWRAGAGRDGESPSRAHEPGPRP